MKHCCCCCHVCRAASTVCNQRPPSGWYLFQTNPTVNHWLVSCPIEPTVTHYGWYLAQSNQRSTWPTKPTVNLANQTNGQHWNLANQPTAKSLVGNFSSNKKNGQFGQSNNDRSTLEFGQNNQRPNHWLLSCPISHSQPSFIGWNLANQLQPTHHLSAKVPEDHSF